MAATRRVFLMKAAAAAAVSASSLKSWSQQARELTTEELIGRETMSTATGESWERWIGGSFKVTWKAMKVGTLILESVETSTFPAPKTNQPGSMLARLMPKMPVAGMVRETQSIVLLFRTTGNPFIQEEYTLQHDWLGTFDLVLVPASPATRGSKYTAVITSMTGRMVPMP